MGLGVNKLTHVNPDGSVEMVDVGSKTDTKRTAIAGGRVTMQAETLELLKDGSLKKGDALTTAKIAGIMAAKRTSELIPLCHPLDLNYIDVVFELDDSVPGVYVKATAKTTGKTGVEMEALTAVSVACLTIYDMAKAVDKAMHIEDIKLLEKFGGKSGHYIAEGHVPEVPSK